MEVKRRPRKDRTPLSILIELWSSTFTAKTKGLCRCFCTQLLMSLLCSKRWVDHLPHHFSLINHSVEFTNKSMIETHMFSVMSCYMSHISLTVSKYGLELSDPWLACIIWRSVTPPCKEWEGGASRYQTPGTCPPSPPPTHPPSPKHPYSCLPPSPRLSGSP